MPKVSLKRPCIMAPIGERVAIGVSEHVWVRLEAQLRQRSRSLDHAGEPSRRKWRSPLRGEHEWRFGLLLALEPPQRP